MFKFKDTIEKTLSKKLTGYFIPAGRAKGRILMNSSDFRRDGNYYIYEHIISGNKSRILKLTYCAAGNCLEDIGRESSTRHFWDIINFIPKNNVQ